MDKQPTQFNDRAALIAHVKTLSPGLGDETASVIEGGRAAGEALLAAIDPAAYGSSRNFLDGAVTRLSPYIRHGIVTLNEVRNRALEMGDAKLIEKFIQELGWRDFWQRIYAQNPDWIWHDIEAYKTGFSTDDYADTLPDDIGDGETDSAAMNHFITELKTSGYLHNHARMYLAAYIVHWRRVKWQAGARWMLYQLLDGDPASNNLSWQWIASTFSNKPYIFNLENVARYCGPDINIIPRHNLALDQSYERLTDMLFPHRGGPYG